MSATAREVTDINNLLAWEAGLTATDACILEVAYKLYVSQQQPGTCYNAAFFLCYYLKKHHGIDGHVEVGFIHDGVNDRFSSHAWYVHKGRIVDIAISRPLNPHLIYPGPLTILGCDIIEGWKWQYFTADSEQGRAARTQLEKNAANNPNDVAAIAKQIHVRMANIATSKSLMRAYLDRCPPGMSYRDLVKSIQHVSINSTPIAHELLPLHPSPSAWGVLREPAFAQG